jgi:hypothetical protein
VGGVSRTNEGTLYRICIFISQKSVSSTTCSLSIENVPSFLKNDEVQQPVILPNIDENQNPWHMHIFNIHNNIQHNKRLLTQKLWEELAGQMMYPI